MTTIGINGVDCILYNSTMPKEEIEQYINYLEKKYKRKLSSLEIHICEDDENDVELHYKFRPVGFERIRRITGYLVGTMDKWNTGKTAEEHDRVKHGVTMEELK